MTPALEYRAAPLVLEGRRLLGTVMRYGDVAHRDGGTESFAPGAFTWSPDLKLNRQHQRHELLARLGAGLTVIDSPLELRMVALIPRTAIGDDTLSMVRSGLLRGLSVGFAAVADQWRGSHRTVQRAWLDHIGVVDDPDYGESTVEARSRAAAAAVPAARAKRRRIWL